MRITTAAMALDKAARLTGYASSAAKGAYTHSLVWKVLRKRSRQAYKFLRYIEKRADYAADGLVVATLMDMTGAASPDDLVRVVGQMMREASA